MEPGPRGPQISLASARAIALAAQGFADSPPRGPVTRRHISRVVDRVRAVQIDSVNVVSRSHYLPFFSRLGAYPHAVVDERRDRPRQRATATARRAERTDLVEYWAHEASLVPVATWPYLGFRMRSPRWQQTADELHAAHRGLLDAVVDTVHEHGPLTSRQVEHLLPQAPPGRREHWGWNWSAVKESLEHLFRVGALSSAGRTAQFERQYAALEQVLPADVVAAGPASANAPSDIDCGIELMRLAAKAHGIGTEICLRDYFRLPPQLARDSLAALVRTGEVEPVTIRGWNRPAYLHGASRRPLKGTGTALLSPFDSLIWQRERTEQLFGFHYRLEIYVPRAKRVHGYYVLPFLLEGNLVARVDLKADRAERSLRVHAISYEQGAPRHTVEALRIRLQAMAEWLGLERVVLA